MSVFSFITLKEKFRFVAGATREIGTALTRICLRHKAVEARMKTFTRYIFSRKKIAPFASQVLKWRFCDGVLPRFFYPLLFDFLLVRSSERRGQWERLIIIDSSM